ncbi:MAG: DUF429 domain-containing protein [Anaerolineaceae bacterium]|nr:DUF429 domain-containing protein [Anaerolineaceae bacterium]MCB9102155.1 DUF429 domain-containing protein [Anaerolineales bacterium]
MDIYGLDFTSAPSRRKPITCLLCHFEDAVLHPHQFLKIASLNEFEVFLKRRGPWVAGFDFPFGQPQKLIDNMGWPLTWAEYIEQMTMMSQQEFEDLLTIYRQARQSGDKHHLRATDAKAKAISPMMLHGVPVGKMFFKGAPRLLRAGLSILPCHLTEDNRIALEAYPALVARKWLGRRSYKNDLADKQTPEQATARRQLIDGLRSSELQERYGLRLDLDNDLAAQFSQDPTADGLDALLCAIQAAWAYTQASTGYGIPAHCNANEGWIVDPELS